ncbi:hypothetical protein LAJLEIBI_03282 [[Clostridium] hylemonae DSM 15053]|nr:hypothetical protein LAJLEIBI_03282 [[Clostridium] hylemonae DSM 15053]
MKKKLQPIERGPGGSLPRMTAAQRKRANALIRNTCCNYDNGNCLLLDDGDNCTCPQTISYSVCCIWFRRAVLPQDDFHAYMVEKYPDLERGESASKTGRKHIPTRLFKQAVSPSKQAGAIEAALDGINPLNAGKEKEDALSMLKKWFPLMENFSGQLKKYKATITDLLEENKKLEARAKASEKGKLKDTMERAKLESELHNIHRVLDRIPPEALAELKRQQHDRKER